MTEQTHEKIFEIRVLDCGHQMKVAAGEHYAWCTFCGCTQRVDD